MKFIFTIALLLLSSLVNASITTLSSSQCEQLKLDHNAPVPCSRLRNVSFTHIDFTGQLQQGEMVTLDAVAVYVQNIFDQLYKIKFPIHQAKSIEHYQGDDDKSMQDNNSTAFNYRKITGNNNNLSLHAYGVAIDINPLQNPFVEFTSWGTATFKPLKGYQYLNRKHYRFNKPASRGFAEQTITLFADNGFRYWGGDWDSPIDFQHFQISRDMATLMAKMPAQEAQLFFNNYVNWSRQCRNFSDNTGQLLTLNDYSHFLTKTFNSSLTKRYIEKPTLFLKKLTEQVKATPALCFGHPSS